MDILEYSHIVMKLEAHFVLINDHGSNYWKSIDAGSVLICKTKIVLYELNDVGKALKY